MIKYNRVTSPLTQISNGIKSWLVIDVIFMLLQLFQDTFKYIVYFSLRGVLAAISSPWRKDVERKVEVESRKENEARKWTNRRGEEKRREREWRSSVEKTETGGGWGPYKGQRGAQRTWRTTRERSSGLVGNRRRTPYLWGVPYLPRLAGTIRDSQDLSADLLLPRPFLHPIIDQ